MIFAHGGPSGAAHRGFGLPKPKFDVFLNYNSNDVKYATEIAEALEFEGLRVWFDRWELTPGVPWVKVMEEAVTSTDTMLVLIGNDSIGPAQEDIIFIASRTQRNIRLVPIILPGSPIEGMRDIPPSLMKHAENQLEVFNEWNRDALTRIVQVASSSSIITSPLLEESVPKVFLCHAKEDDQKVERLFYRLKDLGIEPWYDKESLTVGDRWEKEIITAIQNTDFFAICFSITAAKKRGFIQNEIRTAVKEYKHRPEDMPFLLPIKIEPCNVPEIKLDENTSLADFHWIELFEDNTGSITKFAEGIRKQFEKIRLNDST